MVSEKGIVPFFGKPAVYGLLSGIDSGGFRDVSDTLEQVEETNEQDALGADALDEE